MKQIFVALLAFAAFSLGSIHEAHAVTPVALSSRTVYNCCNVVSTGWLSLGTTVKAVKNAVIANYGTSAIIVGFGAAGSESQQLVIPGGTSTAVLYPINSIPTVAVSIKSAGSTGGAGEFDINLLYN